ncbi:hypothetical protein AW27_010455 [Streptomyces sp. PCS3-D2]|nr:hypothetical protein [Streptomyces sp. PCS3-D2]WKV71902.1 hypothetical protein AW27_010455 [Streptomyces sp. PCS3-D2]
MTERYEYLPHPLLRRRVRDVTSGIEGELMAVISEDVSDSVHPLWVDLAYVRGPSGREFSTAVDNIESADLPPGSPHLTGRHEPDRRGDGRAPEHP